MRWKATSAMEERLRFVARVLDGEPEFGISRTGYKTCERYKEDGLEALTDRSRRPVHNAMAEGVGFEPTVPLRARRFSRPVP